MDFFWIPISQMNKPLHTFKEDILSGLKKSPKSLPSKYFYDDTGSMIFQEIMDMPDYYLPEAEFEIIQTHSEDIAKRINLAQLDIIELGAGDGRKMAHFIKIMSHHLQGLSYFPLDISEGILKVNERHVLEEAEEVSFKSLAGDYFKTLPQLRNRPNPRLVVFSGSNIGNFRLPEAVGFLKFIKNELRPGDFFLLGVDLKKNPKKILKAYNDPSGITKRFNLNLLSRINRELNANFDLKSFDHYATYHPLSGAVESFIVSLKRQTIQIDEELFELKKDEVIQTEISQKYDMELLEELSKEAGFRLDSCFTDHQDLFSWVLLSV
jgi:L-histidine Nalpha-methyltransferase